MSQLPIWATVAAVLLAGLVLLLRRLERRRAGRLHRFVEAALAPRLLVGYDARVRRPLFWLAIVGFAALLLAIAQPRWGEAWVPTARGSRDIVVLLDTSESMNAVNPAPTRLERARIKIRGLLERMPADRFGLIVFSGGAVMQVPLTLDHAYFQSVLNAVTTDSITEEGTNIAAALREAKNLFQKDAEESGLSDPASRCVLLISDGEQVSGDALAEAQALSQYGTIFVMGIGDEQGAEVRFPEWERQWTRVSRDNLVHVSRLDEETLIQLARSGGGAYVRSMAGNDDLEALQQEMAALSSRAVADDIRFSMVNRYRWPLAVAFLCLAGEGLWIVLMPFVRRWRMQRGQRREAAHGA